ncbi:MAG: protein phosphatase 2C domain-containing protein [Novosphingobium sp.]
MTPAYRLEDTAETHVGKVRSENEDSQISLPESGVWLVADGMGGHANGRYASQTIAGGLDGLPIPADLEGACEAVSRAVQAANAEIFAKSVEAGAQMGSTFVSLVISGGEFAVLWAGDSRAYLFRGGQLFQLSTDHTQVEAMLERGLLTPEEAADHPMKHVLARAVGVEEHLQIDAIRDAVEPRDVFLLCSDGLHGLVSDAEIAAMLADKAHDAAHDLIALCLDRGAPDNVTIALVAVNEPTLLVLDGVTP